MELTDDEMQVLYQAANMLDGCPDEDDALIVVRHLWGILKRYEDEPSS